MYVFKYLSFRIVTHIYTEVLRRVALRFVRSLSKWYMMSFSYFCCGQLSELQNQVGASQFEQLLQTLDTETLEQVREYVVL
jgi:hypothetical protein